MTNDVLATTQGALEGALKAVRGSPSVLSWTRDSLNHRRRVARDTAARLRRLYGTGPYAPACAVLAGLEDQTVAACEELLAQLDAAREALAPPTVCRLVDLARDPPPLTDAQREGLRIAVEAFGGEVEES